MVYCTKLAMFEASNACVPRVSCMQIFMKAAWSPKTVVLGMSLRLAHGTSPARAECFSGEP